MPFRLGRRSGGRFWVEGSGSQGLRLKVSCKCSRLGVSSLSSRQLCRMLILCRTRIKIQACVFGYCEVRLSDSDPLAKDLVSSNWPAKLHNCWIQYARSPVISRAVTTQAEGLCKCRCYLPASCLAETNVSLNPSTGEASHQ